MAAALDVPVVGVCSLDAFVLAGREATGGGPFAVVTDARRREVYWAGTTRTARRVEGPAVDRPADVAAPAGRGRRRGRSGRRRRCTRSTTSVPSQPLSAADLAHSGRGDGVVEELPVRPLYLRRPDATPPGPPKAVLA